MRLKLGKAIGAFQVTRSASPPAPGAAPAASATTKADLDIAIADFVDDAEPFAVTLAVPPCDPATSNTLEAITVVLLPHGHGQPIDAASWMASPHPRATIGLAPAAPATLAPAPAAVPTPTIATAASAPAATPTVVPISAPAVAPAQAQAVASIPAPAPVPAVPTIPSPAVASASLPGPAGGHVTLTIPGLMPGVMYTGQVIEQYDA